MTGRQSHLSDPHLKNNSVLIQRDSHAASWSPLCLATDSRAPCSRVSDLPFLWGSGMTFKGFFFFEEILPNSSLNRGSSPLALTTSFLSQIGTWPEPRPWLWFGSDPASMCAVGSRCNWTKWPIFWSVRTEGLRGIHKGWPLASKMKSSSDNF